VNSESSFVRLLIPFLRLNAPHLSYESIFRKLDNETEFPKRTPPPCSFKIVIEIRGTEKDGRFGRKGRLSVSSGDADLGYGCEEHGPSCSTRWRSW
jgi:hypothetical protein